MTFSTNLGESLKRLLLQEPDLSRLHKGEVVYDADVLERFFTVDMVEIALLSDLVVVLDLVRFHNDGITLRGTVTFPARMALGQVRETLKQSAPFAYDIFQDAQVTAGFDVTLKLLRAVLKETPAQLAAVVRFDHLGVEKVGDINLGLLGKLPLLKNFLGTDALRDSAFRWLGRHIEHHALEHHERLFVLGAVPALKEALDRPVDFLGFQLRWPQLFENIRAQHSHEGVIIHFELSSSLVDVLAHRFVDQQLIKAMAAKKLVEEAEPAPKAKPKPVKKPPEKKDTKRAQVNKPVKSPKKK